MRRRRASSRTGVAGSLRTLVVAILALWASVARAQGLGDFMSPGPLAQPHAEYDSLTSCTVCHQAGKGVSAARCLDCHDEIQAQVAARRGFHGDKGSTCQPCHLDHRGRDYQMVRLDEGDFDHGTTGFPLRGGHSDLGCAECHTTPGEWTGLSKACTSCHEDPHGSAASTRALTADCTTCHSEDTWRALPLPATTFDHDVAAQASFPLEGAHAEVACDACHETFRFVPTAHDACTTCHEDPHRANFSDDCATCHAVRKDWLVPRFDHAATSFRLEGVHRDVSCRSCHPRGVTKPVPHETCASCHDDPHAGQFAPRPCDACHSVTRAGFALADFDHAAVGWPLEGRHADATCASCHGSGPEATYVAVSRECATCHEEPYVGHFAPSPCADCHTPADWRVEAFDHVRTGFELTGAHATVACASCHPPHVWAGVPHGACSDCHEEDPHDDTVGACTTCHATVAWADITFEHGTLTSFPLTPQHGAAACTACHAADHFVGLGVACETCHLPDRPAGHFTGACDGCHREARWLPADLGPGGHAVTGFPLQGAHERLACVSCHPPDRVPGAAPTDCVGCHATDDAHRNLLGDACGDCHTESTWVRTRWRHQLTGWPLHGAHRLAACDDCHAGGYAGTPDDCRQCHLAEAPMNVRAHSSPQFVDCAACHKPYTWVAPRYAH